MRIHIILELFKSKVRASQLRCVTKWGREATSQDEMTRIPYFVLYPRNYLAPAYGA